MCVDGIHLSTILHRFIYIILSVMERIEFRKATVEDYDDVIAIRQGVYDGRDYLPALYKKMIQTHDGYLALLDGKLIAFLFTLLLDNGATLITRAGRVNKDYERKGLFKKLSDYVTEQYTRKQCIERIITVVHSLEVADSLIKNGQVLLYQRNVSTFKMMGRLTKQIFCDVDQRNTILQTLDRCELYQMIERGALDHFIPDRGLVLHCVPLGLAKSNIELVFLELGDVQILASFLSSKSKPTVMSFGFTHDCEFGKLLNVDFVGSTNDYNDISSHIVRHAIKYIDSECSSISWFFTYPTSIDETVVKHALQKLEFDLQSLMFFKMFGMELSLGALSD